MDFNKPCPICRLVWGAHISWTNNATSNLYLFYGWAINHNDLKCITLSNVEKVTRLYRKLLETLVSKLSILCLAGLLKLHLKQIFWVSLLTTLENNISQTAGNLKISLLHNHIFLKKREKFLIKHKIKNANWNNKKTMPANYRKQFSLSGVPVIILLTHFFFFSFALQQCATLSTFIISAIAKAATTK